MTFPPPSGQCPGRGASGRDRVGKLPDKGWGQGPQEHLPTCWFPAGGHHCPPLFKIGLPRALLRASVHGARVGESCGSRWAGRLSPGSISEQVTSGSTPQPLSVQLWWKCCLPQSWVIACWPPVRGRTCGSVVGVEAWRHGGPLREISGTRRGGAVGWKLLLLFLPVQGP